MSKEPIKIRLNGKTYALNPDEPESLRKMPWADRKELIDLLENIKQAEYVNAAKSTTEAVSMQAARTSTKPPLKANASKVQASSSQANVNQPNINLPSANASISQKASKVPELDPSIKASGKDVDDVMQRLILEQQQHNKPIPDKSSVIKIMLVVFGVIIGLMLIF